MTATRRPRSRPGARRQQPGRGNSALLLAGAILALVVVFGLVFAFGPGDEKDDDTGPGTSGQEALDFAPVSVEGTSLAKFTSEADDPAIGATAPRFFGQSPDGGGVAMEADQPTLLVFLAHWCPHCQAELPRLVDMQAAGAFEGIRLLAVLTGTNPDAPNYPPAAWLEREGWAGDVLVDDETFTAANAYGLSTYPYLVALDANGTVVGRTSGERSQAEVAALVALATGG